MKNYKFLVPILLVALLGGSVYKTYSDREKINKQYDNDITQARQNRKLEVYVNAEEDYLDALKLKDSAKLRAELGEMYIEAEDLRTAAKWGESLISEYPKEQVGYEFLIQVYLEQKDYASCFRIKDEADGLKISSKKIEEIISDIKYEYYLEGEYAQVEEFSNGYAAVKKEKKWGYLNSKGHRVIESEFEEAGAFAKEVAPVIDDKGRAFYIDNEGNRKIVIDFVDNIEKLGYMSMDNIFPVNDGKKWSLYSLDSKKKIAGDYDEVSAMGNGVAAVKFGNKWSLIDTKGKKVTKDKYDSVVMDSKGIVCRNDRVFAKQNGYYYLFDSKGNKVVKTKFDDARLFADDGYAAVCVDGKWGFVDKDGKQMIKPQFNEAHSFSNGLAAVRFTNGWGYVDEKGNKVIATGFDDACDFNEQGKTFVKTDDKWQVLTLYLYNHES